MSSSVDLMDRFKPSGKGVNMRKEDIRKALEEIGEDVPDKYKESPGEEVKDKLTKNEHKLLKAIKLEARKQKTEDPLISRGTFIKKYRINNRYLDASIKGLISRGMISKNVAQYTGKIQTSSWKVLVK